jgi:hypothetical protein
MSLCTLQVSARMRLPVLCVIIELWCQDSSRVYASYLKPHIQDVSLWGCPTSKT